MSGSSPRKLRREGVNLLGGRARTKLLHLFCWKELGKEYDLPRAARHGLLQPIYFSDDPAADLQAYTGTYLQQEIVAEGATRNVPAFRGTHGCGGESKAQRRGFRPPVASGTGGREEAQALSMCFAGGAAPYSGQNFHPPICRLLGGTVGWELSLRDHKTKK
jgi:hypothetical protein